MESELELPLHKEAHHSHHDFSPLSWNTFFDKQKTVEIEGNQFNVYLKGNSGPVFLLLHGNFIPIFKHSFINQCLFKGGGYTGN